MHTSGENVKVSPQLYLLDGSSFIYRAYYGIRDLATSSGMPSNAVFGFTKMLLGLLQEKSPEYLAVVFDRPREETFRREIYPEYKANRDAVPEDLTVQIPYIKKVLQALNIPALEAPGFEADDVIATLARRYAAEGIQVTVVTGDKDLMQIVGDRICLLDTMKDNLLGASRGPPAFRCSPRAGAGCLGAGRRHLGQYSRRSRDRRENRGKAGTTVRFPGRRSPLGKPGQWEKVPGEFTRP